MQNKTVTKSFASHLNETHNAYKIEKNQNALMKFFHKLWNTRNGFDESKTHEMDLIIHSLPKKTEDKNF